MSELTTTRISISIPFIHIARLVEQLLINAGHVPEGKKIAQLYVPVDADEHDNVEVVIGVIPDMPETVN